ncbi:uncharacterized protein RAG0_02852 [Rhynchosporium agropyri]|uniref:Uncharacterized protein n=1 Tax=Rhynchosporium agropyri TaxID=914238 RepID=A0A1E1K2X5_9HELO|nr:uncharacterized protein RAG0_02852 [Rhynchosporium agropyri]
MARTVLYVKTVTMCLSYQGELEASSTHQGRLAVRTLELFSPRFGLRRLRQKLRGRASSTATFDLLCTRCYISLYPGISCSIVESVYAGAKRLQQSTVVDVLKNSKLKPKDGVMTALISTAQQLFLVDNTEALGGEERRGELVNAIASLWSFISEGKSATGKGSDPQKSSFKNRPYFWSFVLLVRLGAVVSRLLHLTNFDALHLERYCIALFPHFDLAVAKIIYQLSHEQVNYDGRKQHISPDTPLS